MKNIIKLLALTAVILMSAAAYGQSAAYLQCKCQQDNTKAWVGGVCKTLCSSVTCSGTTPTKTGNTYMEDAGGCCKAAACKWQEETSYRMLCQEGVASCYYMTYTDNLCPTYGSVCDYSNGYIMRCVDKPGHQTAVKCVC